MAEGNAPSLLGMVPLLLPLGPNDPEIFVTHEWDLTKAQEYLKKKQEETGLPLTITQLVGYCASRALKDEPDLNGRICFGNVFIIYHPS